MPVLDSNLRGRGVQLVFKLSTEWTVPAIYNILKDKGKLECAVDVAPSQISTLVANVANSMTDGLADEWTDLLSHTLTIRGGHVGWIPPSGLEGDIVTDRWTDDGSTDDDGRTKNYNALTHPYNEPRWWNKFGWIPPSGLRDSVMDRWTEDGCTDGRTAK